MTALNHIIIPQYNSLPNLPPLPSRHNRADRQPVSRYVSPHHYYRDSSLPDLPDLPDLPPLPPLPPLPSRQYNVCPIYLLLRGSTVICPIIYHHYQVATTVWIDNHYL